MQTLLVVEKQSVTPEMIKTARIIVALITMLGLRQVVRRMLS